MSTKNTNNKNIDAENLIKEGYKKGVLKATSSTNCPYTLTVEAYKDTLDPINLSDFFKESIPEKVWVKYSSLRMKNRCNNGRPVSINNIKKR